MISKKLYKIITLSATAFFVSFGPNKGAYAAETQPLGQLPQTSISTTSKNIIVKYKAPVDIEKVSANKQDKTVANNKNLKIAKVQVDATESVSQKISEYKNDPAIEYAEPDYKLKVESTPNDTLYYYQWGPPAIKSDLAWDKTLGDKSVYIAVVDTGVDSTHPDLQSSVIKGYNTITDTTNTEDDNGHGTHVAGIAAALKNNNTGIAGIASGCTILPIKVLDSTGAGYSSDIIDGITWATDHYKALGGKKLVINLSIGSPYYSQGFQDAIDYARSKSVLVVAAAGNENTSSPSYPAAYNNVIGVSAVTPYGDKAYFSNYGNYVDVAAPGQSILSTTYDGTYGYKSGTSMASPFVAGEAALLWSANPDLTVDKLEQTIETSAKDIGDTGKDQYYGYGLIDALNALNADGVPDPNTTPSNVKITNVTTNAGSFSPYTVNKFKLNYTLNINAYTTFTIYDSKNNAVKTILNNTLQYSGQNSIAWNGRTDKNTVVPDGVYTYKLTSTFSPISEPTATLSGQIIIDGTAPTISLSASSQNSTPYKLNASYSLNENGRVSVGIYNSRNALIKQLENNIAKNSNTTYSATWDGKDSKGTFVPDDTYTVKVVAVDNMGNVSRTASQSFMVDLKAPQITNVTISTNKFNPFRTSSVIHYVLSEKAVVNITIYNSKGAPVQTLTYQVMQKGNNYTTWNGRSSIKVVVPNGTYTYKMNATDLSGKKSPEVTGTIRVSR